MVKTDQGPVPRLVDFRGNFRQKKKGRFDTSDQALIEAMDERIDRCIKEGRRLDYICVREEKIPEKEVEATPRVVKTKDGEVRFETDVETNEVKQVLTQKQKVGGISDFQGMAKWLKENIDGVTHKDVNNKDKATRIAAEHNIDFVDLKQ